MIFVRTVEDVKMFNRGKISQEIRKGIRLSWEEIKRRKAMEKEMVKHEVACPACGTVHQYNFGNQMLYSHYILYCADCKNKFCYDVHEKKGFAWEGRGVKC